MKNRYSLTVASILAALILSAGTASADVESASANQLFGISAAFNDVFFGDYVGKNGDIEGHAAIQGNLTATSYGIGTGNMEKHADNRTVLVVGGNVTASGTGIYDGDAYVGGTVAPPAGGSVWNSVHATDIIVAGYNPEIGDYTPTTGTIYANSYTDANGNAYTPHESQRMETFTSAGISSIPFDFTVAQNELRTVASDLSGMSNTVDGYFDEAGNYQLKIDGTGIQVATIDASIFAQLDATNRNLFITAGDDATLVINVSDVDGLNLLNLGQDIFINGDNNEFHGGFDGSNILFNTSVENVTVLSSKINASILALDAHFDVRYGHITGQVFGASAYTETGGEFHAYYTFDDKHFGTGTVTPEPASFLIVGLGLAGFGIGRRFRKNRQDA